MVIIGGSDINIIIRHMTRDQSWDYFVSTMQTHLNAPRKHTANTLMTQQYPFHQSWLLICTCIRD